MSDPVGDAIGVLTATVGKIIELGTGWFTADNPLASTLDVAYYLAGPALVTIGVVWAVKLRRNLSRAQLDPRDAVWLRRDQDAEWREQIERFAAEVPGLYDRAATVSQIGRPRVSVEGRRS